MKRKYSLILASCIGLTAVGCGNNEPISPLLFADTIYKNGTIITMDGDNPTYAYPEAVAVSNGIIMQVDTLERVLLSKNKDTKIVDLKGSTMLPGFIDAHGHFMSSLAMVNQANLSSAPVGDVNNISNLMEQLLDLKKRNNIADDDWLIGWGYDPIQMNAANGGEHLTKFDLVHESLPKTQKIMLIHVSMHGAVLNSAALDDAGIDETTETPEGGVIARVGNTMEPAGLIMEMAYLPVFEKLPQPTEGEMLELMKPAQMMYASEGYTNAQEGFTHIKDMDFLLKAAAEDKIFLDIVSLPGFTDMESSAATDDMPGKIGWLNNGKYTFGVYDNGLKFQGMKITQDGSPQGKTAFMTKAYRTGGPNGEGTHKGEKKWFGETTQPETSFAAYVNTALDADLQVFIHANGDGTVDQAIRIFEDRETSAADDLRPVIIHSQFQRPEHLQKYKNLGITPSYFTNHTFYWGDEHVTNLGQKTADFISPMNSAKQKGLIFSNHTDFNVTPLDPFFTIWTATTRESRGGHVIGKSEQVSRYVALQSLTIGPAYQLFEENRKGKIKMGLLADFVILDKNPLDDDLSDEKLKAIKVIMTIKEDKIIYTNEDYKLLN